MLKSIIYIVVVNQERLISAVPHLYYHRRLFYRLYFTVSLNHIKTAVHNERRFVFFALFNFLKTKRCVQLCT